MSKARTRGTDSKHCCVARAFDSFLYVKGEPMETSQLLAHCGTSRMSREELRTIPIPAGTATYQPVPHHKIVEGLIESLSFRHISVVRDEYDVSTDGM